MCCTTLPAAVVTLVTSAAMNRVWEATFVVSVLVCAIVHLWTSGHRRR
jgi:hypothetical protein